LETLEHQRSNYRNFEYPSAATAQKQAGEAVTKAADAQTRLEVQRERTAKLEAAVAEAQAQARKFEAEIASSNARAEEAKRLAEREKLERVKLEAQVAPETYS